MAEDDDIIFQKNPYMKPCQKCGELFCVFPKGSIVEVDYSNRVVGLFRCPKCEDEDLIDNIMDFVDGLDDDDPLGDEVLGAGNEDMEAEK